MLLIQSHERNDDVLLLQGTSPVPSVTSRATRPDLATYPIRGHFVFSEGNLVMLYRLADELHFRVGQTEVTVTQDASVEIRREKDGSQVLTVLPKQGTGVQWKYVPPPIDPPLELDPTAFAEREDFDFGLLVFGVLNNPGRRQRIYR